MANQFNSTREELQIRIIHLKKINHKWKFGFNSVLYPGTISWSLKSWPSKAAALRVAKGEY